MSVTEPTVPAATPPDRPPGGWRPDAIIATLLAVFTIAARWPLRARYLWSLDSVLYALAVEDFDLNAARPHPPGFPVFVAMARIVNVAVADPVHSLVILSLLLSAAGVVLLYLFTREVADQGTAFLAALLLSVTPVFFLQGLVMLSYTTEVVFGVAVAWCSYRLRTRPSTAAAAAVGALWGLAMGTRPSLFFSLTPLVAWTLLWPLPLDRAACRRGGIAAGAALSGVLVWAVPVILDTGFARWRQLTSVTAETITFRSAVWNQGPNVVVGHARLLMEYFADHGPVLFAMALLGLLALLTRQPRSARKSPGPKGRSPLAGILLWWSMPWLGFLLLVHAGMWREHEGYILVLLPPICVGFGLVAARALRSMAQRGLGGRTFGYAAVLALVGIPILHLGSQSVDHANEWVGTNDDWVAAMLTLGERFPANETVLVPGVSWPWAKWYFPNHHVLTYIEAVNETGNRSVAFLGSFQHVDDLPYFDAFYRFPDLPVHALPANTRTVVLIDGEALKERIRPDVTLVAVPLGAGRLAYAFAPDSALATIEEYFPH